MHWCPDCLEPCFCDSDDTDYGTYNCNVHDGIICREERNEDEEEFEEDEEIIAT